LYKTVKTVEQRRAYMRTYMADYYLKRRNRAIALLGGRCIDCASDEALEFDHVDRLTKTKTIGSILLCRWETVEIELAKCVLRCQRCHRSRTNAQLAVEHGGGVSGKKNCPCPPCRARKAEWRKNRKNRTALIRATSR
jgi:hypothetical protein